MPIQLLPKSAAAFAPRPESVTVIMGLRVQCWLIKALEKIRKDKRHLTTVKQQKQFLIETLSSEHANWTLTTLTPSKTPRVDSKTDACNPLIEAIPNHDVVYIKAYVVFVDILSQNVVAYKLTLDTIDALVKYHKEVYCVNAKASTCDWTEKDQQCEKLHNDFILDINKFVFRTDVSVLQALEHGGGGKLSYKKGEKVKNNIRALMKPLTLPSPPCFIETRQRPILLPRPSIDNSWRQTGLQGHLPKGEYWTEMYPSPYGVPFSDTDTRSLCGLTAPINLMLPDIPAQYEFITEGFFNEHSATENSFASLSEIENIYLSTFPTGRITRRTSGSQEARRLHRETSFLCPTAPPLALWPASPLPSLGSPVLSGQEHHSWP
ncbi:hypothetical protein ACHAO7_011196 [Fusarium culmorum]